MCKNLEIEKFLITYILMHHTMPLVQFITTAQRLGMKPSLICKICEERGNHFRRNERWLEAIEAYETIRRITKYRPKIVKEIFQALQAYLDEDIELGINDLLLIENFIDSVLADYDQPNIRNFYAPSFQIGYTLKQDINQRIQSPQIPNQSANSHIIFNVLVGQYEHLDDKDRISLFADIMAKAMTKHLLEKKVKKKDKPKHIRHTPDE